MVVCAEHCLRERRFFPGLRVNCGFADTEQVLVLRGIEGIEAIEFTLSNMMQGKPSIAPPLGNT
jgi:hypothetical protein